MRCEATYTTIKGLLRCNRTTKRFPHEIHSWVKQMAGGAVMEICWRDGAAAVDVRTGRAPEGGS